MYIRIKYRPHATRSHLTIHEEKKCELITTRHANSQIENNGLKVLLIAYAFSESLVKVMPFLKTTSHLADRNQFATWQNLARKAHAR